MGKKREHDGDLYVSGNLRVLGGIQNVQSSAVVTRVARTAEQVTTVTDQVAVIEEDITDIRDDITGVQGTMRLLPASISRARSGSLSSSTVAVSGIKSDGTGLLARFTIELSHDGTTFQSPAKYTSPEAGETGYVYTVDSTMVVSTITYNVAAIRYRMYKVKEPLATMVKELVIPVLFDASNAPVYWGALTADPIGSIAVSDYYWDDRPLAASPPPDEGGIPRIYNGTSWVEFDVAMAGYQNAMVTMLPDMGAWATEQGETVAAASAIFTKLVTADAFIANLFTQFITVGSGGRIRYETGTGVQKRAVQLADEKIDWLDTPDTDPASPEVLRARIGRLGVGGAVLMNGEFHTSIESQWSASARVWATGAYVTSSIQDLDDDTHVAYTKSSNFYPCEVVFTNGVAGSEIVITPSATAGAPNYFLTQDGILGVTLYDTSPVPEMQLWLFTGGIWAYQESVPDSASSSFAVAIFTKTKLCVFFRKIDGLYVNTKTAGTWGTSIQIDSTGSGAISSSAFVLDADMVTVRCSYTITGSLKEFMYDTETSSVTGLATILAQSVGAVSYIKSVSDELFIFFTLESGYPAFMRRSQSDIAWSSPFTIENTDLAYLNASQSNDGIIHVFATKPSDSSYIHALTLQRYARIGAGIIESGSNTNGSYIKHGDGTMEQWNGEFGSFYTTGNNYLTFPTPFINDKYGISGSVLPYAGHTWLEVWRNDASSFIFLNNIAGNALSWHAIGRWEE